MGERRGERDRGGCGCVGEMVGVGEKNETREERRGERRRDEPSASSAVKASHLFRKT